MTNEFAIPTERRAFGRTPRECVIVGPLAVHFAALPAGAGWYVTHTASGATIGQPWRTLPLALVGAGALLAMPIAWEDGKPVADEACARIAREAMQRVRGRV